MPWILFGFGTAFVIGAGGFASGLAVGGNLGRVAVVVGAGLLAAKFVGGRT